MLEKNEIVDGIYVARNVFSANECKTFVELSENTCHDVATVNALGGSFRRSDLRNNHRVINKAAVSDNSQLATGRIRLVLLGE